MTPLWVSSGTNHRWPINPNFIGKWGRSRGEGESGSSSRGEIVRAILHAVHLLIDKRNENGSMIQGMGSLLVLLLSTGTKNIVPGTKIGWTLRMAVLPGNGGKKSAVRA